MARVPYVMPAELIAESNAGVDWSKVYPGGTLTTEQKVIKVCREVSDTIDRIVGSYTYQGNKRYILTASEDTESALTDERFQAMIDSHGQLLFIANYRPVASVTAFRYAPVTVTSLASMNSVDLSLVSVEGRDIKAAGIYEMYRYSPLRVSVTYVNGFANTLLASDVSAAATTMTVLDSTGVYEGYDLEIMGDPAEGVLVESINGNVLTLSDPLSYAHSSGVRVTAIPRDVTRAAIYLAWDIAQGHAREAMAIARLGLMGGDDIRQPVNFYHEAERRLQPYILTP